MAGSELIRSVSVRTAGKPRTAGQADNHQLEIWKNLENPGFVQFLRVGHSVR